MPAEDGRERRPTGLLVVVDSQRGRAVVRPPKSGIGGHSLTVDPCELAHPQVDLDRRQVPAVGEPDVAQGSRVRGQELGLVLDAHASRAEDVRGEHTEIGGVDTGLEQLVGQRVGQEEIGVADARGVSFVEVIHHRPRDLRCFWVRPQRTGCIKDFADEVGSRLRHQAAARHRRDGGRCPFVDLQPRLGDDGFSLERRSEDELCEVDHLPRVGVVAQGR